MPLTEGYIALQGESHPTEFRKVELLNLKGCMDPKAALPFDLAGGDSSPFRQVAVDLMEGFAELLCRSYRVVLPVMMERDGEVDQALEEPALRLDGGRPDLLEDLMALNELATIEEGAALVEEILGDAGHGSPSDYRIETVTRR